MDDICTMEKIFLCSDNSLLKKINKCKARKLWDNGKEILIIPCNMRPDSEWYRNSWFKKELAYMDYAFDKLIWNYEYYNCLDGQTGFYAKYYIREGK